LSPILFSDQFKPEHFGLQTGNDIFLLHQQLFASTLREGDGVLEVFESILEVGVIFKEIIKYE
jgi:hypothetical protein